MANPDWFPLATAAATTLAALVAAAVALRSAMVSSRTAARVADLASRTTLQSSYTQNRLETASLFLEAVEAVIDDPSPATRRRLRARLLRVQLVFQPAGSPVEIAERIYHQAGDLLSNKALGDHKREGEMLRQLETSAGYEEIMIEDPRNHIPADDVSMVLVRDEILKIRDEDDQALKDKKPALDRDDAIYGIEHNFPDGTTPDWLSVPTLLAPAEQRAARGNRLSQDRRARHDMRTGCEDFVREAGQWLSEPPPLKAPRGAGRKLSGLRLHGRQ
ncbi:hypothetical protein AB0L42_26665 [Streptomyces sp. NPDC052287]|uniref:hypothetical protein n=1 Tax=Streptomyces sp. NPDC052287 TaxID=3154950 RepID=UPI0034296F24